MLLLVTSFLYFESGLAFLAGILGFSSCDSVDSPLLPSIPLMCSTIVRALFLFSVTEVQGWSGGPGLLLSIANYVFHAVRCGFVHFL